LRHVSLEVVPVGEMDVVGKEKVKVVLFVCHHPINWRRETYLRMMNKMEHPL
jgi:hypothetical protein